MVWHNLRHAIDEWNAYLPVSTTDGRRHRHGVEYRLNLVAPSDQFATVDHRFCDVAQRQLIAVFVPSGRGDVSRSDDNADEKVGSDQQHLSRDDMWLVLSMCTRFRIPCLVDRHLPGLRDDDYIINVGVEKDLIGRAIGQLVAKLMWNSFVLVYQRPEDAVEMADVLSVWQTVSGARTAIKSLQLPPDPFYYDAFLKYIRERIRITNIVVHGVEVSTIHALLVRASRMNMTESRYSYLFTNPDLRLLEDFFSGQGESAYHCNITGIQFLRQQEPPFIKNDLALAMEAVSVVLSVLRALHKKTLTLEPQALLCDAGDVWHDGEFFADSLRHQIKIRRNDATNATATRTHSVADTNETSPQKQTAPFDEDEEEFDAEEEDTSPSPLLLVPPVASLSGVRFSPMAAITRTINERFIEIGEWVEESRTWRFEDRYEEKWKFRRRGNHEYLDLTGEKLRVVVYLEEPFVMRKHLTADAASVEWTSSGGGNGTDNERLMYEGFCIDLLCKMASILNFTFEIFEVEDGTYGVEDENGIWNGIIGVLQRREADLSISAVTITYSRVSVIDFTLPFMHLGIAILVAKNGAEGAVDGRGSVGASMDGGIITTSGGGTGTLFTFLEPLSFSVWIALAISYVSLGCALSFLARVSPYEWFNEAQRPAADEQDPAKLRKAYKHKNQFDLLNSLWFAVGSLMHQGSDVIPRAAATRALALVWWMFTLILISTYTAQLAAFLTVERMTTSIESAADLAAQQRIKFGTLRNGSTMDFFRESKIPIYERMWSIMQSTTPTVFVNTSKEGIARVKAGNYAYMMESSMLEFYMSHDCQLETVGGLLDSKGYGVAVAKGSPLRTVFSQAILQLQESTILEALKNKWWNQWRRRNGHEAFSTINCAAYDSVTDKSHSSLKRVFGIFYVLYAGILLAVLIAVAEYCVESRNQSLRMGLTLLGKCFNWLHSMGHQWGTAPDASPSRNSDSDGAAVTSSEERCCRRTQLDVTDPRQLRSSPHSCTLINNNAHTTTASVTCNSVDASASHGPLMIKGSNSMVSIMENNRNSLTINHNGSGGVAVARDMGPVERYDGIATSPKTFYEKVVTFDPRTRNGAAYIGPHDASTSPFFTSPFDGNCDHRHYYHYPSGVVTQHPTFFCRKQSDPLDGGSTTTTTSSLRRKASALVPPIFAKLSTPAISVSVDASELDGETPLAQSIQRLIPQADEMLLMRRISSAPMHQLPSLPPSPSDIGAEEDGKVE